MRILFLRLLNRHVSCRNYISLNFALFFQTTKFITFIQLQGRWTSTIKSLNFKIISLFLIWFCLPSLSIIIWFACLNLYQVMILLIFRSLLLNLKATTLTFVETSKEIGMEWQMIHRFQRFPLMFLILRGRRPTYITLQTFYFIFKFILYIFDWHRILLLGGRSSSGNKSFKAGLRFAKEIILKITFSIQVLLIVHLLRY